MVKDLGLSALRFRNQAVVEHTKHVETDLLELGLDLLTVIPDGRNMFVGALGFFLLLDRGNNSPGGPSCADDVLVCDRQKISLVNCELSTELFRSQKIYFEVSMNSPLTLATSFI